METFQVFVVIFLSFSLFIQVEVGWLCLLVLPRVDRIASPIIFFGWCVHISYRMAVSGCGCPDVLHPMSVFLLFLPRESQQLSVVHAVRVPHCSLSLWQKRKSEFLRCFSLIH